MSPAVDDGMFNMEFDQPAGEIPTLVGNLDFGATGRRGSGVIGPRLEAFDTGRIADKFEVQEGEHDASAQKCYLPGACFRLCGSQ